MGGKEEEGEGGREKVSWVLCLCIGGEGNEWKGKQAGACNVRADRTGLAVHECTR